MEVTNDDLSAFSVSTVNGTDDREALPKHWVAALVQVRCEKAISKKLQELHIENYVPTQWEYHQWSDRKKRVERVVIPMVVFIHTDKATEKRLHTYSFINKLVSYPGQYTPATIPDSQIESLKYMLSHTDKPVEMHNHIFKTGEIIRIARGPLKGFEGELYRVETNRPMVAIHIECLGYACVNIDKSDIELIC